MPYASQLGKAGLQTLVVSGILWAIAGCVLPPESVSWRDDQKTVGSAVPAARGWLVVETEYTGMSDRGQEQHAPIYVYDPSGRYVTWFPNDSFLPSRLGPGRYVIVSRVSGQLKRVQIEIRNQATLHVRLKDLQEAPTAELSRLSPSPVRP